MEPDEGSYKWGVTTSLSYFPKDNSEFFDGVDMNLWTGYVNMRQKMSKLKHSYAAS